MIGNRFVISAYTDKIHDTQSNKFYYFEDMEDWYKICVLLNKQNREIDFLKSRLGEIVEYKGL